MPYRSGFGGPQTRVAASLQAIVPASIVSSLIGTSCLTVMYFVAAAFAGALSNASLEDLLSMLVFSGGMIAIGSIAGIFYVAFHLLVFGLPVALILGERIRSPLGLSIAIMTGAASAYAVVRWLWGIPSMSYDEKAQWETMLVLTCFAMPAAWFYRQQIIAMLDEHDL